MPQGNSIEIRELGLKAKTDNTSTEISFNNDGIYADTGSHIVYANHHTEQIKTHPIGENDSYNGYSLEYVGENEDGEQIYELLDEYTFIRCLQIYQYDEKTYELTEIGSIDISTQIFDKRENNTAEFTGAVTLNGKIYAFTDVGMSCYSLKNTEKPLFTDVF